MKYSAIIALTSMVIGLMAFRYRSETTIQEEGIHWISFEEAVKLNKKEKRKMFIDFYTSWCGWCKRMDATTFKDPGIVDYVNKHYYAVKFNAEQRDSLVFNDHTFKYLSDVGNRGIHEFALSALNGRPSYPSIVFFDEKINRITIAPGYKDVKTMESMLNWIYDNAYMKQSWDDYNKEFLAKQNSNSSE